MRRAGRFLVRRMRPWSWPAFMLGLAVVAASAALQGACVAFGADLYFAAFMPGIFVVALVAGIPASVFALLLSIPVVWWGFMPPFFAFSTLTIAHAHSVNLFFLFGALLIGLADLCRETLAMTGRGSLRANDEVARHSR